MTDFSSAVINEEVAEVSIYPNPTSDYIQIELLGNDKKASFQLFANNGRLLSTGTFGETHSLNLQHIEAGIFHPKLQVGSQVISHRIIKL